MRRKKVRDNCEIWNDSWKSYYEGFYRWIQSKSIVHIPTILCNGSVWFYFLLAIYGNENSVLDPNCKIWASDKITSFEAPRIKNYALAIHMPFGLFLREKLLLT